jgi:hypothetical protein
MAKKCPRYVYHKLNFPAKIFHDTVYYLCMYCFGVLLPWAPPPLPPFFTFHGLILLLVFRFLWFKNQKRCFYNYLYLTPFQAETKTSSGFRLMRLLVAPQMAIRGPML